VLGGTPQEQFIASIAEAAVESAYATGVPASVTIAQAILESYWGSSRLAREANNYFGIKAQTRSGSAGSVRFDVWEVIGGRNVMQSQAFRAYKTVAESFVDHGVFFVENGRYARAMAVKGDPRQFAREVNRAGYATDPSYASKLIGLMDRYELYRYDDV
jgi:flagellar protein FlgJ